jgi:SanA protein
MKEALLRMGVPATALTLDYAGLRTLDSVARAREVFGLDKLTIVTDDFLTSRAVFLARHFGLDAVAFSPTPVPLQWSAEGRLGEIAARVRAVADVFVLNKQPKYLCPKVQILDSPLSLHGPFESNSHQSRVCSIVGSRFPTPEHSSIWFDHLQSINVKPTS